ncbi:MAG TPA: hypothetical protein VNS88_00545, partial [Nitrospiraceae bacterium]|nr:hypothetical protein [Nitrospiraceae bacterium]
PRRASSASNVDLPPPEHPEITTKRSMRRLLWSTAAKQARKKEFQRRCSKAMHGRVEEGRGAA